MTYYIKTEVLHSTDSRFHMQMKEERGGCTRQWLTGLCSIKSNVCI